MNDNPVSQIPATIDKTFPEQSKIDPRREQLILDNMDLVTIITGKYCKKFRNVIPRDELYSAISCALVQSASRFDFSLGKCFRKFVSGRLHGSVIDYIRSVKNWGKQHCKKESSLKNIGYLEGDMDFPIKQDKESLFETESFFEGIKAIVDEEEYEIIHEIIFNGITVKELARKRGEKYTTLDYKYRLAKEKIKVFLSEQEHNENSQWVPIFWRYDIQKEMEITNRWQRTLRNQAISSMKSKDSN